MQTFIFFEPGRDSTYVLLPRRAFQCCRADDGPLLSSPTWPCMPSAAMLWILIDWDELNHIWMGSFGTAAEVVGSAGGTPTSESVGAGLSPCEDVDTGPLPLSAYSICSDLTPAECRQGKKKNLNEAIHTVQSQYYRSVDSLISSHRLRGPDGPISQTRPDKGLPVNARYMLFGS